MTSIPTQVAKRPLRSLFSSAHASLHRILLNDYDFLSEDVKLARRLDDCLMWLWAWEKDFDEGNGFEIVEKGVDSSLDKVSTLSGILESLSGSLQKIQDLANAKVDLSALYVL